MDYNNKCTFCSSTVTSDRDPDRDIYLISCPICGEYRISSTAMSVKNQFRDNDGILFSGYIRNHSEVPITILSQNLADIPQIVDQISKMSVQDKIDLFLSYVGKSSKYVGDRVSIEQGKEFTKFYFKNKEELNSIIDYLKNRKIIETSPISSPVCFITLSVEGWAILENLKENPINSKKVFIAMNFDEELKKFFEDAIHPACIECGFEPIRVDYIQYNEKICDKIISEIKESKFLIADFTGQKQGVYFEAGYAQGMGLPVIWTCRKDEASRLHFDTRQYNHIVWENIDELREQLKDRIKATIR